MPYRLIEFFSVDLRYMFFEIKFVRIKNRPFLINMSHWEIKYNEVNTA